MKKSKYAVFISLLLVVAIAIISIGAIIKKEEKIILQGVIECREYRIASKIAGRIESVNVSEGDKVTAGELLYTISTPELQTKLTQATAARAAAEAVTPATFRN